MTTVTAPRIRYGYAAGPAQVCALVVGLLLLVLGILGFIPGVTTDLGTITFASPDSHAMIFGLFQTTVLRNVLFIIVGLAGLGAPRSRAGATLYIVGAGGFLMTLWLYNLLFGNSDFGGNIFSANLNDFALDFCLGLAILIAALATSQFALFGSDYEEA
ncbi:uncharacterized protein DUF4383 [Frondihabitans sp. PhB188]|uniref:DUF4383 domain-containing protein n=1 Tax=Frondihabitans sp. PhB188 TaxID=2485200 RepID=UPI000F467818|nr:DUF4383 domain-containing protein [Frondihabitans sp. PhB188]ROQ37148.1 uncharacterized protein DUF4383 [Frondihabitans sp. PhB188]